MYWSTINNFWISNQSLLNSAWTRYFLGCYVGSFLRALEKLRKAIIAFITSVCPFVRMQQLGFHWKDVMKFEICSFRKAVKKIQVSLKSVKNSGTSHGEQ